MDLSSSKPHLSNEELLTATQIVLLLKEDEILNPLYSAAIKNPKIGEERFENNFRRLLESYGVNLQAEAKTPLENGVAELVLSLAIFIASLLRRVFDGTGAERNEQMRLLMLQNIDDRNQKQLEKYLKSWAGSQPQPDQENLPEDQGKSPTGGGQAEGDTPSLAGVKPFMTSSKAFQMLRHDFSKFVNPGSSRKIDQKICPEHQLESQSSQLNLDLIATFPDGSKDSYIEHGEFESEYEESDIDSEDLKISTPKSKRLSIANPPQEARQFDSGLERSLGDSGHSSEATNGTHITTPETSDRNLHINDLDSITDDDTDSILSEYEGEERIRNPRRYFQKLADLEAEVFQESGILLHGPHMAERMENENVLYLSFVEPSETRHESYEVSGVQDDPALLILQKSKYILERVCKIIESLQSNDFCAGSFSIIVQDAQRPDVANLRPVPNHMVIAIYQKLHDIKEECAGLSFDTAENLINQLLEKKNLRTDCEVLRRILELPPIGDPMKYRKQPSSCGLLYLIHLIASVLDVAVVSYVGAHIERFDQKFLGTRPDIDGYLIPYGPKSWGLPEFGLCRRKLACLDKFLGGEKVWVFHTRFDESEPLFLSTDIQTFADIWGPLWKVANEETPDNTQQYNVGNGSIIPWSMSLHCSKCLQAKAENEVKDGEVFCHWVSFKEWDPEHNAIHRPQQETGFSESSQLLIGAETGFTLNKTCVPTIHDLLRVKNMFSEQHAIRPLGVEAPRRVLDADSLQFSGNIFTLLTLGGSRTYKRQSGMTMKDAIVERWRNHQKRNAGDLELYGGLEVSLCTRNALRTRLLDVLHSRTMRNYLKSVSFDWTSPELEAEYFSALENRRSFRHFWKNCAKGDQETVGNAISLCFDELQHTGVNPDNRHLDVLWVEAFETSDFEDDEDDGAASIIGPCDLLPESNMISLFRSEFTWTGLIKDSMDCCTMAVMAIACLSYNDRHHFGRRCRRFATEGKFGYPVMKTSLSINKTILKDEGLQAEEDPSSRTTVWNVESVKKGAEFHLGDHGKLTVRRKLSHRPILEMEWQPCLSETVQEVKNVAGNQMFLGRGVEKHHWEYMQGAYLRKPISILVLSSNTKPLFESKGKERAI
ncbi:hypothetical protein G7Y89_g8065 [Cudoniella acicularis]|uniref:Uncharacterized protein n=1 Tax=Cudoniella acicularis TaxID=354080 RepID=A0A8H4RIU5_9HELO|nr:hypothetical protein G7Y89_g8065 [Cudoniella acicularis]